ncbi:Alpha/Beta hydrolase protein [Echria macrotheca]|uniref:Alpha/Beta hydrolase protein n=1 Tax=Echria macrotheca TaxID=438768 RepID=A0AAJ0BCM0_9PEZI|nr:Alpha/Beta hydrolase protein [Echria macrotheca]
MDTTLPEPTLTLTLPSLHDGLALDCRVYHPPSLAASPKSPTWRKHAAIIAHPYAPLGGCCDDPVVETIASSLLRLGFLVGTFNFRGANGSAGRTSWTSKAETADYMSFVGFITHYVHFLDPFRPLLNEPVAGSQNMARPRLSVEPLSSPATSGIPILLLGGYSYGAMITTNLPSVESILAPFAMPARESPAAEIRQRAQHLAEMQNTVLGSARAAAIEHQSGRAVRKSLGVRVGGDEDNRKSHDSRRSFSVDLEDRLHRGMSDLKTKTRIGHKKRALSEGLGAQAGQSEAAPDRGETESLARIPGRTIYRPAYLLVSPLQGVVTNLATMSLPSALSRRGPIRSFSWSSSSSSTPEKNEASEIDHSREAELKLTLNPTLAIYGDRDGFVPVRKLRDWRSRLEAVPHSQFRAHEVSGAGHFWFQGNAAPIMRDAVRAFAESILEDHDLNE